MEQAKIIENSKILAQYVGWVCRYQKGCQPPFLTAEQVKSVNRDIWVVTEHWGLEQDFNENNEDHVFEPHSMQFHSSWDWLIPAWAKFKAEFTAKFRELMERKVNAGCYFFNNIQIPFQGAVNANDVLKAFKVISEGIGWYNSVQSVQASVATEAEQKTKDH